jgi:hypothetical protein
VYRKRYVTTILVSAHPNDKKKNRYTLPVATGISSFPTDAIIAYFTRQLCPHSDTYQDSQSMSR